jgi:DNA-binding MarR family transcriptional regulator
MTRAQAEAFITLALQLQPKFNVRHKRFRQMELFVLHRAVEHTVARVPLTVGEAADLANISPSHMTRIVASLEAEKYVRCSRNTADKRQILLEATDAGLRFLADFFKALVADSACLQTLCDALSDWDIVPTRLPPALT